METVKLIEKLPIPEAMDVNALENEAKILVREKFSPFFAIAKTKITADHAKAAEALDNDDLDQMNAILKKDENKYDLKKAASEVKNLIENVYDPALQRLRTFKQEINEDGFIDRPKYEKFLKSRYTDTEWCEANGISEEDRLKAVEFVESVVNYDSVCSSLIAIKDVLNDHAENVKFVPIIEGRDELMFFVLAGAKALNLDSDYNEVITKLRKVVGTVKHNTSTTTTGDGNGSKKSKLGSYGILLPDGTEIGGNMVQSVMRLFHHLGVAEWKVNPTGNPIVTLATEKEDYKNNELTGTGIGWSTLTPKIRTQLISAIGQAEADKVLFARTGDGVYVKYNEV